MKISKLPNKISRKLFLVKKDIVQMLTMDNKEKRILFILGCQRSGTTLMLEIFENDPRTKTFGEFSKLSSQDTKKKIRLNPLNLVEKDLQKERVPFIVLKPLVESQNASELLDYFEGSKVLWMYRDYRDVALSNLDHFSHNNGYNNIKPILQNDPDNWRSEKVIRSRSKNYLRIFFSRYESQ